MAVIMGYAMGTIDFALFLYLDELGASAALMGITVTVTCISEAPAFFCNRLAAPKKWGISRVLHMVVGCYLLRLWLYTQLASWGTPWAVLPIELLHGLTFGCGWAAGTVNSARISPPGLQATTQAIFMSLYQGPGLGARRSTRRHRLPPLREHDRCSPAQPALWQSAGLSAPLPTSSYSEDRSDPQGFGGPLCRLPQWQIPKVALGENGNLQMWHYY
eukprot:jgi/Botrbrau1/8736/Bobra.0090s0011.1